MITGANEEPSMREVLAQHLHTFFADSLVPWSDVAPDRRDKWLHGADLVMAVMEPYRVHDMNCRARQVLLDARSELYNLELPGDGLVYRSQVSQMLQRVTMRVGTEDYRQEN